MAAQPAAPATQPVDAALVKVVLSRPLIDETREIDRVRQFAEELARYVRERDPQATFTLQPPIDPGIWLLYAHVTPPLDEDFDFGDAVTERSVDLQIEHDVSIAVITIARRDAAVDTPSAGQPPKARRRK